ncbi:YtxH domain-containing protein [Bacillus solitudinis]|uniref:YtxH domain-containing protein n=1 Tax=Bacillus solitudinis TaxID=2014074 RepID=UPI000C23EFE5|nr:YtxH domain-containing protein [Bacillus solitudinis]
MININNRKSVAVGTVVGGVVGATAVLLTSPKSGEELRSDISQQITEGKNKTGEVTNQLKNKMSELREIINQSSSTVSQTVKKKSEDVISEAMQLLKSDEANGEMSIEDLKEVVRGIMREEIGAGEDIKQVVENEIKEIERELNQDINDLNHIGK